MSKVYLETPYPSQDTSWLALLPALNAVGMYTNCNRLHPHTVQCEQKAESGGPWVIKLVILCVLAPFISTIVTVEKNNFIKETKNDTILFYFLSILVTKHHV